MPSIESVPFIRHLLKKFNYVAKTQTLQPSKTVKAFIVWFHLMFRFPETVVSWKSSHKEARDCALL